MERFPLVISMATPAKWKEATSSMPPWVPLLQDPSPASACEVVTP